MNNKYSYMLLNIYLLSHPLIKKINYSTNTLDDIENFKTDNSTILYENKKKFLGLFLFYESMRRCTHLQKLYIKKLNQLQEVYILDPNQEYAIITNINYNYQIITEIKILIPKIKIIHFDKEYKNKSIIDTLFQQNITSNTNIILLEQFLHDHVILDYIAILNKTYNIMVNKINILCFTCENKILDQLGQKYPKLNIYTTNIINNQ